MLDDWSGFQLLARGGLTSGQFCPIQVWTNGFNGRRNVGGRSGFLLPLAFVLLFAFDFGVDKRAYYCQRHRIAYYSAGQLRGFSAFIWHLTLLLVKMASYRLEDTLDFLGGCLTDSRLFFPFDFNDKLYVRLCTRLCMAQDFQQQQKQQYSGWTNAVAFCSRCCSVVRFFDGKVRWHYCVGVIVL